MILFTTVFSAFLVFSHNKSEKIEVLPLFAFLHKNHREKTAQKNRRDDSGEHVDRLYRPCAQRATEQGLFIISFYR